MLRTEAMEEYGKAQKLGQKDYREKMLHGQSRFCRCWMKSCKTYGVETSCPWAWSEIPIKAGGRH